MSSRLTFNFLKSPSLMSGKISASALYSRVSSGTNLVISTLGIINGAFLASEKASGTVRRTAMSAVVEARSLGLICFSAISAGTLPLRKP